MVATKMHKFPKIALILSLVWGQLALPCWGANHTPFWEDDPGLTLYAYPDNLSLEDWLTNRVALAESTGDDTGKYSGTLSDTGTVRWVVFEGSSQPTTWAAGRRGHITLIVNADVTRISSDAVAADNLETATDGGSYNVGGGAIVDDVPTNAEFASALSSLESNLDATLTSIAGEVSDILVDTTAIPAFPANFSTLGINASGHISRVTLADLLTEVATGGISAASLANDTISAAKIAPDVTTELQSGLATSAALSSVASSVSTLATASSLTTVGNDVTTILADTAELQADWTNGGRLDNILDARASQTSLDTLDLVADSSKIILDNMLTAFVLDGSVYKFTTNALEETPLGEGETAEAIATAVWGAGTRTVTGGTITTLTGHTAQTGDVYAIANSGTHGLAALKTILDTKSSQTSVDDLPTNAELAARTLAAGSYFDFTTDAVNINQIEGVDATDTLDALTVAFDAADIRDALGFAAANFDTQIASLATGVADLPTNAELAASQASADDATLAAIATAQAGIDDLPTNAELTTALGTADDAVLAALATAQSAIDAIENFIDTEISTLLTQTGAAWIRSAIGMSAADLDSQIAGIEIEAAGLLTDVNQEPVPDSRVFTLVQTETEGLTAPRKSMTVGAEPTFAVDFRNDVAANGRIITVQAPEISVGTAGGITFDEIGRDKSQAKFRALAITAGTYEVLVEVIYESGATAVGTITIVVAG